MKRQRGRNRGGNKPQQHNANRAFDSTGPEGIKVRGNAQHVYDKYQQLARDASSSGDRVLAESYLQHAEHYFRLIRATQPHRPVTEIVGRDAYSSGLDIDFEDESGAQAAAAAAAAAAAEQGEQALEGRDFNRQDGQRQGRDERPRWENRDRNRDRDDRPRDRDRDDRPRDRDDRPRDRDRDDRPRDDRPRDDRPREDRPRDRDDRPRDRDRWERRDREDRRPREDRGERDPLAVVEPEATPLPRSAEQDVEPRPRLRSTEGDESHAPAFLKAPVRPRPAAAEAAEEAPKPRRGRRPKSEPAEAAAEEG